RFDDDVVALLRVKARHAADNEGGGRDSQLGPNALAARLFVTDLLRANGVVEHDDFFLWNTGFDQRVARTARDREDDVGPMRCIAVEHVRHTLPKLERDRSPFGPGTTGPSPTPQHECQQLLLLEVDEKEVVRLLASKG